MCWQFVHCFTSCVIWKPHKMQCSPIWKLRLYKLELGHNVMEATKNICAKSDGAVDHSTVTRWFKKYYKNLDNQSKPDKLRMWPSSFKLEANPASRSWTVSGKLGISQFSVVHYLQLYLLCYQNFAKLLIHSNIWPLNSWFERTLGILKTKISIFQYEVWNIPKTLPYEI